MGRIRALVVDDSALMRGLLTEILSSDPGIEVVGSAMDPAAATDKILRLEPDVITLDIEMPRMDGLTFLEKLMRVHPLPVVMVSSLTARGASATLRALELGAVDFVPKPKLDVRHGTLELAHEIIDKVKCAARARVSRRGALKADPAPARPPIVHASCDLIAMGASTGGTEALKAVLTQLPADMPGIVIVQHMPEGFTEAFADRLNTLCALTVREAREGERVQAGLALLAPGNQHIEVRKAGAEYRVHLNGGERVHHHRPSVDVLFRSCALLRGARMMGVILTGMGADGADGLLAMRQAGARTIAQDEATSVVYGMPREAFERGGVERVVPLPRIASVMGSLVAS